ncbi:MAG: aldo/keto reductase [Bdellovibrionales bacterium]|nr:aldo/keto reductase [Bdellovibrionales bacterium]
MNTNQRIESLCEYRLLGKTGLRVSPLCLGTMTFGDNWGWGSEKSTAKDIFDRYRAAGGNFIDTADAYTDGKSEELLGEFMKEERCRESLVLATKFTYGATPGDPNSGGNSRKTIYRSLQASLERLQTDYIDLYWLHTYDDLTPVEEVVYTLNDLVHQGKIRYFGLSDTPAWYATRAQTIAELRGLERVAALQMEYSLVSRNLEKEHRPLASELGMGICAWSPLASGFLTGKYKRTSDGFSGEGRVKTVQGSGNPVMEKFTQDKNWKILDALQGVAEELGRKPAEVALNWVTGRPGITSTLIGATKPEQLEANLNALNFEIPEGLARRLEQASRPDVTELDHFFAPELQNWIRGGTRITRTARSRT